MKKRKTSIAPCAEAAGLQEKALRPPQPARTTLSPDTQKILRVLEQLGLLGGLEKVLGSNMLSPQKQETTAQKTANNKHKTCQRASASMSMPTPLNPTEKKTPAKAHMTEMKKPPNAHSTNTKPREVKHCKRKLMDITEAPAAPSTRQQHGHPALRLTSDVWNLSLFQLLILERMQRQLDEDSKMVWDLFQWRLQLAVNILTMDHPSALAFVVPSGPNQQWEMGRALVLAWEVQHLDPYQFGLHASSTLMICLRPLKNHPVQN
jgi:hypothetical protein